MRTDYRVYQTATGRWVVVAHRGTRLETVGVHPDKDAAIRERDRRAKGRREALGPNPGTGVPEREPYRHRIEGSDLAAGQVWLEPAKPGWGWRIVAAGPAMVTFERIAPGGEVSYGRRERRKRYRMANTLRLFGAVLAN